MTTGPDGFSAAETLGNEPPRRRFPRSLLLAATTALVVVTGAGVATANALSTPPSETPTPSASPTGTGSPSPSQAPSGKDRARSWYHRLGMGIHGEFVVPDGNGGYRTVASQYGEITAVGQDAFTVRSEDGYTREYKVDAGTRVNRDGDAGISALRTGQKVRVVAQVEDGTATARSVHDTESFGRRHWGDRHGWGHRGWGRDDDGDRPGRDRGRSGESPAPSPTLTS